MNAKLKETILNPIFKGNPITVLVLGICSSLAVTVQMKGAFVMGLSVIVVTALSNFIVSLMRNSDTRFEIGKNKGNLFIDYNNGSSESISIPKSELFSDGSIFVRVKFYNVEYPFPRIIVTNSAKPDNPYEYYLYHEKFIREYPTSSSLGTRLIFSDDFGNMKTITFKLY